MNDKILNMTKEELIKNITIVDEAGEKLFNATKAYLKSYQNKKETLSDDRIEKAELLLNECYSRLYADAMALAEMRYVLKEKYGTFVM